MVSKNINLIEVEDNEKEENTNNVLDNMNDETDREIYDEVDILQEETELEREVAINKLRKKHPELSEKELLKLYAQNRKEKLRKDKEKKRKYAIYVQRLKNSTKAIFMIVLVGVLLLFGFAAIYDSIVFDSINPEYMDFSTFIEKVENNEVYAIYTYSESKFRIKLIEDVPEEYRAGDKSSYGLAMIGRDKWYETQNTTYEDFSELIAKHNVPIIRGKFTKLTTTIFALLGASISFILPFVLIIALIIIMLNPTGMNSKDKILVTQTSKIRFKNVIGHEEVIDDLKLYVGLLRKPGAARKLGVAVPKGMIFNGPPGTGKTLIAKALAGEAGVPFIYVNASNVIELYVGMGARTIRQVFKKARSMSPCVVFIDEIDAIGGKRGRWGTSSEDTQTINALLQELDGFREMDNILVIAATNNINSLDNALLRSGRFDRKLEILPPKDKMTRFEMLKLYSNKLNLNKDVNLTEIAEQIVGFTGADIKVLCNEAALIALQNEQEEIIQDNFFEAIDQILLKGNRLKNKDSVTKEDKSLVAYHEAGHAVMCYLQGMPIMRASIQSSTSGVGGFVIPADSDSLFTTKTDLLNMIRVAYAGRASECIKKGEDYVTNGASNDIQRATQLLQGYLMMYGFSEELGMLDLKTLIENNICDNKLLLEVMRKESKKCYDEVSKELKENYYLVEAVAQSLLEKEVLTGEEFMNILNVTKKVDKVDKKKSETSFCLVKAAVRDLLEMEALTGEEFKKFMGILNTAQEAEK